MDVRPSFVSSLRKTNRGGLAAGGMPGRGRPNLRLAGDFAAGLSDPPPVRMAD